MSDEKVVKFYRGRVNCENFIKDLKNSADIKIWDESDKFQIQVNCRQVAGKLEEPIKFAIAVSLEVEEALEINVFNEIQTKLAVKVPVTP